MNNMTQFIFQSTNSAMMSLDFPTITKTATSTANELGQDNIFEKHFLDSINNNQLDNAPVVEKQNDDFDETEISMYAGHEYNDQSTTTQDDRLDAQNEKTPSQNIDKHSSVKNEAPKQEKAGEKQSDQTAKASKQVENGPKEVGDDKKVAKTEGKQANSGTTKTTKAQNAQTDVKKTRGDSTEQAQNEQAQTDKTSQTHATSANKANQPAKTVKKAVVQKSAQDEKGASTTTDPKTKVPTMTQDATKVAEKLQNGKSSQQAKNEAGDLKLETASDFKIKMVHVEKSVDAADKKPDENLLQRLTNGKIELRNFKQTQNTPAKEDGSSSKNDLGNSFMNQAMKQASLTKNMVKGKISALKAVQRGTQNLAGQKNDRALDLSGQLRSHTTATGSAGRLSQAQAQAQSSALKNTLVVQELMNRIQSMLKPGLETQKTHMTMDFESSQLGQMRLAMNEKDGSLQVAVQVGNDSTKEQLMNYRDEMTSQLRKMGFKDVSFDVSTESENNESENTPFKQLLKGNEDAENVKLAGDVKGDILQALAAS